MWGAQGGPSGFGEKEGSPGEGRDARGRAARRVLSPCSAEKGSGVLRVPPHVPSWRVAVPPVIPSSFPRTQPLPRSFSRCGGGRRRAALGPCSYFGGAGCQASIGEVLRRGLPPRSAHVSSGQTQLVSLGALDAFQAILVKPVPRRVPPVPSAPRSAPQHNGSASRPPAGAVLDAPSRT